jgi:hypothetical protein
MSESTLVFALCKDIIKSEMGPLGSVHSPMGTPQWRLPTGVLQTPQWGLPTGECTLPLGSPHWGMCTPRWGIPTGECAHSPMGSPHGGVYTPQREVPRRALEWASIGLEHLIASGSMSPTRRGDRAPRRPLRGHLAANVRCYQILERQRVQY